MHPACFFLGPARYGQEIFSGLIYGARVSLSAGVVGVIATFLLGVTIGGVSGYMSGRVDVVIQRMIEIINSFPHLPLWLALGASLLGASHARILFRHLVPGFTSHIIVVLTLSVPAMILGETALSFLGLGLRPPVVSWGVLLQDRLNVQTVANYPWLLMPVVLIVVAMLSFNFLGDGLRDAADPYSSR